MLQRFLHDLLLLALAALLFYILLLSTNCANNQTPTIAPARAHGLGQSPKLNGLTVGIFEGQG